MAIHHTRRKKALSLIGDEKDAGKIISLLKENQFTDDEVRELLSDAPAEEIVGADAETEAPIAAGEQFPGSNLPPAKQSKYADFDVFMGKAIVKQYRHISGETRSCITHFQLSEKVKTVRIEPALAKDFNRFAIGFIDNPGLMYFPKGTKQVGDIQTYQDATYKPMNETTVTNEFMD
jgi:phosphopantothenoylcysteine synthetase/decarboxylase